MQQHKCIRCSTGYELAHFWSNLYISTTISTEKWRQVHMMVCHEPSSLWCGWKRWPSLKEFQGSGPSPRSTISWLRWLFLVNFQPSGVSFLGFFQTWRLPMMSVMFPLVLVGWLVFFCHAKKVLKPNSIVQTTNQSAYPTAICARSAW